MSSPMNLKMCRATRQDFLEKQGVLAPSSAALKTAQDRIDEKTFIAGLGIPVAPFAAVNCEADLQDAIARLAGPRS